MQSLRELTGLDPRDLTSEEDLVLVKPHEPWPSLEPLPDGVRAHRDGAYLRLGRDSLVAGLKAGYLAKISAQVAVFAGCPRFCCSRRFQEAVTQLCCRATTVVLVHNLNTLWDLLALFPALDTLYLLHDLAVHQQWTPPAEDDGVPHALANGESGDHVSLSPVRASLRLLYGDCDALRLNHLFLGTGATLSLAQQCANLIELEANIVEQATGAPPKLPELDAEAGAPRPWSSLVLGCALPREEVFVSADIVLEAAKRCPVLRHLQIVASNEAAVYSAGAFQELRSLSVLYRTADGSPSKKCRYRAVSAVLSKFSLEALCLRAFSAVSLTGLATSCARLRRLQLVDCELCDLELLDDAFPQLEELEVSYVPPKGLVRLIAACPNLRSLSIRDRGASFGFLREASCPKAGRLARLEQVALNADRSLREMGLEERDLRMTVDALPALARVAVDSFEARLFLAEYAPRLELDWSTCSVCAARFPQWNREHVDLWAHAHKSPDG
ncbi:uncharacterized protein LOC142564582 [Dermacentor variabilis]|uniref:uncharacterized protein LOC142564582 n=1 Tax=Dermacentor variabilis TaxID=34621 RepID=UPI003F5BCF9A